MAKLLIENSEDTYNKIVSKYGYFKHSSSQVLGGNAFHYKHSDNHKLWFTPSGWVHSFNQKQYNGKSLSDLRSHLAKVHQ